MAVSKAIINVYVRRIERGAITIEKVPATIRDVVAETILKKETNQTI